MRGLLRQGGILFACAALLTSGCQQQSRTTMDLLRAGDAGVCTASDVEDTLRGLIRPKDGSAEDYTIAFADASLEAFDKVVSRATCNAAMTVDGPNGSVIERTLIDYVVAPSAQDPTSFLVSGNMGSFQERLKEAAAEDAATKAESDQEQHAQEALAAMVKPGWLIGRWVPDTQGSSACSNGPFDQYARGGRITGDDGSTGRWRLDGLKLTLILPNASGSRTITEASQNDFAMEDGNGEETRFRRCSAGEIQAPPEPPLFEPGASEPQPDPDPEPSEATRPREAIISAAELSRAPAIARLAQADAAWRQLHLGAVT